MLHSSPAPPGASGFDTNLTKAQKHEITVARCELAEKKITKREEVFP